MSTLKFVLENDNCGYSVKHVVKCVKNAYLLGHNVRNELQANQVRTEMQFISVSAVIKQAGCRLGDQFLAQSRSLEFFSLPTPLYDRGVTGSILGTDAGCSELFLFRLSFNSPDKFWRPVVWQFLETVHQLFLPHPPACLHKTLCASVL